MVAAGSVDAYYEVHVQPWDCLAGMLIVREAEGWTNEVPGPLMLAHGGLGRLRRNRSTIASRALALAGKNLAVALCTGDTLAGVLLSRVPSILSARRCLIVEGEATLRGVPILYRCALLPLSDDGVGHC
jgi:hypothetical protein